VVAGEAFEPPAQKRLVAHALRLELETDAIGLQVEVAAVVPELRHEVVVAVVAAVRRGRREGPREAHARFARREHPVQQVAGGVGAD
jgi:hypothetical protein